MEQGKGKNGEYEIICHCLVLDFAHLEIILWARKLCCRLTMKYCIIQYYFTLSEEFVYVQTFNLFLENS
jgi:hypothetical protein